MIIEENHQDKVIFDYKNSVNLTMLNVTIVQDYLLFVQLMINKLDQDLKQAKLLILELYFFRKKKFFYLLLE